MNSLQALNIWYSVTICFISSRLTPRWILQLLNWDWHLDTHDWEDEPEDEADEEHVEDGGNGVHQSVHDNLENFKPYTFVW